MSSNSILIDEQKKNLLLNLIQSYIRETGELPDIKKLQALGMSSIIF